ncbi:hypothetical protein BJ165DRAFT_1410955 [Panaeolus papilionaceus]|nr:hypothetical protein BJ165DRAFT_1410955 [Panaeolus papilionaceus]
MDQWDQNQWPQLPERILEPNVVQTFPHPYIRRISDLYFELDDPYTEPRTRQLVTAGTFERAFAHNLRKRTDATRSIHRGLTVRILAPSALISAAVDILSALYTQTKNQSPDEAK